MKNMMVPMGLRSTDSLAGIQTAALYAGGTRASDSVRSNLVSDYDGTSWSAGTVLPATRTGASQSGTATDALGALDQVRPFLVIIQVLFIMMAALGQRDLIQIPMVMVWDMQVTKQHQLQHGLPVLDLVTMLQKSLLHQQVW